MFTTYFGTNFTSGDHYHQTENFDMICILFFYILRNYYYYYYYYCSSSSSSPPPPPPPPLSLALASLIIDAHSSLSNAFVLHRFTPSFLKSSSISFIHLSLGRPLPLLPSNFPSKFFFTDLFSFFLLKCPRHSNFYEILP